MTVPLCFTVVTSADPQAVLRVLGLFAQRDQVPRDVAARRVGEEMHIRVEMEEMSEEAANILCWKMRQIVCVRQAEWAVTDNVTRLLAGMGGRG